MLNFPPPIQWSAETRFKAGRARRVVFPMEYQGVEEVLFYASFATRRQVDANETCNSRSKMQQILQSALPVRNTRFIRHHPV